MFSPHIFPETQNKTKTKHKQTRKGVFWEFSPGFFLTMLDSVLATELHQNE